MNAERIVAVALLTQRDLDLIGTGFRRLFTVDEPDAFADLLAQLDTISAGPPHGPDDFSRSK